MGKFYQKYRRSKYWKSLRKRCYEYYNGECVYCGNSDKIHEHIVLSMHHLNYRNFYQERIGIDVILICKSCHFKKHKKIWMRIKPKPIAVISPKEKLRRKKLGETMRKNLQGGKTITDPRYNETSLIKPTPIAE